MGNSHSHPDMPPPRRSNYTPTDPVYPLYMYSPQVDDKPFFPIEPIFADQPRKPSRRQSRNFTTGSKRRYASHSTKPRNGRIASYFPGTLNPDEARPFDAVFSEPLDQERHHGTAFIPPQKYHRSSRKGRTHNYSDGAFFPPGLSDAGYQQETSYNNSAQYSASTSSTMDLGPHPSRQHRKRHHVSQEDPVRQPIAQQSYEPYNAQPPPLQPAVSGCAIPHGGQIVPLVTCPHSMLGCMVCGRCYHDG